MLDEIIQDLHCELYFDDPNTDYQDHPLWLNYNSKIEEWLDQYISTFNKHNKASCFRLTYEYISELEDMGSHFNITLARKRIRITIPKHNCESDSIDITAEEVERTPCIENYID